MEGNDDSDDVHCSPSQSTPLAVPCHSIGKQKGQMNHGTNSICSLQRSGTERKLKLREMPNIRRASSSHAWLKQEHVKSNMTERSGGRALKIEWHLVCGLHVEGYKR